MRISDWSSDVCSSDLNERRQAGRFPKRGKETDELRHHDERAGRGLCQSEAVQHFSGLEPPEGAHGFLRDIGKHRISAAERHHRHLAEEGGDAREHRSEEHTSELQSLMRISYDVYCLKKK